jgi:toxin ParE1/3/4
VKVCWTAAAKQDRLEIVAYIRTDNPRAAARMDQLFSDAAARLARHPRLGRPGKIPGTWELIPHESYRLIYEIDNDTVWALALVHTARLRRPRSELPLNHVGARLDGRTRRAALISLDPDQTAQGGAVSPNPRNF